MSSVLESVMKVIAGAGWNGLQAVNQRVGESPSRHPDWAPGPLLKSREKSRPPSAGPARPTRCARAA